MLLTLLGDISGRRRRRREQERAEGLLLALLDRKGSVDIDDTLAAHLKVGRKALMQAVYSLALREAIHMLSNAHNDLRIMTLREFERFMTVRAQVVRDAATPEQPAAPAAVTATVPETGIPPAMADMESGLFTGATLGGAPQYPGYDWFAIDVAPPEEENAAAPEPAGDGKILPDREREPWVNCVGVGLD